MTIQPSEDTVPSMCPPEIARASLTVLRRMAHAVTSIPYSPPSPAEHAAWAEVLGRTFATLPPNTRKWIKRTPALAEVWEWQWQGTSAAERSRARRLWRDQLNAFAALHPQFAAIVTKVPSAAVSELPPRSAGHMNSVASAMASMNEQERRDVDAAEKINPELARNMRARMDEKNFEWASRMSQQIHDGQMGIIRNITS